MGGTGRTLRRAEGEELWPATVLSWRKWLSLRRREDRGHGGAGERALHPLCPRELPAGRGEGVVPGVSWEPGMQREATGSRGLELFSRRIMPESGAPGAESAESASQGGAIEFVYVSHTRSAFSSSFCGRKWVARVSLLSLLSPLPGMKRGFQF